MITEYESHTVSLVVYKEGFIFMQWMSMKIAEYSASANVLFQNHGPNLENWESSYMGWEYFGGWSQYVYFSDFSKHSEPIDVVYLCLLKLVPHLYRKKCIIISLKRQRWPPQKLSPPPLMFAIPVSLQSRLSHNVIHLGAR